MNWIKTSDHLPEVGADGESEYVLAYRGRRVIPQIVKFSDGSHSKRGWYTQQYEHIPFRSRRLGAQTFSHWCKIELPKETTN